MKKKIIAPLNETVVRALEAYVLILSDTTRPYVLEDIISSKEKV